VSAVDQALLFVTTFVAGLLNVTVGGGGLLQIPVLMLLLPRTPVAVLVGTVKLLGFPGLAAASATYVRKLEPAWPLILRAALAEIPFAIAGARIATLLNPAIARPIVLAVLTIMAAYVLFRPHFGEGAVRIPRLTGPTPFIIGAALGLYEGFLGSGSGTILIVLFVGVSGLTLVGASVASALVTLAGVAAAMITFLFAGSVLVGLALKMMVFNVAGALIGARLVMLKNNVLLRRLLGTALVLLIARLVWDMM
jgi:hypothetical protein